MKERTVGRIRMAGLGAALITAIGIGGCTIKGCIEDFVSPSNGVEEYRAFSGKQRS